MPAGDVYLFAHAENVDLIVFVSLDVAALTVQAIGGASASQAASRDEDADQGARTMLWGIILQLSQSLLSRSTFPHPPLIFPHSCVDGLRDPGSRFYQKISL